MLLRQSASCWQQYAARVGTAPDLTRGTGTRALSTSGKGVGHLHCPADARAACNHGSGRARPHCCMHCRFKVHLQHELARDPRCLPADVELARLSVQSAVRHTMEGRSSEVQKLISCWVKLCRCRSRHGCQPQHATCRGLRGEHRWHRSAATAHRAAGRTKWWRADITSAVCLKEYQAATTTAVVCCPSSACWAREGSKLQSGLWCRPQQLGVRMYLPATSTCSL